MEAITVLLRAMYSANNSNRARTDGGSYLELYELKRPRKPLL